MTMGISRLRLALCACALMLPLAACAGDVNLEKPVEIQPGKGVAVFSITLHGAIQTSSSVKWREIKEDKRMPVNWNGSISLVRGSLFGTEELSKSPRQVWGRLAALMLPPGVYEFYDFNSDQLEGQGGGGQRLTLFHARRPFSRKFNVEAGKIQYVGNLDIHEGPIFSTTGGLMAGVFLGMFGAQVEVFPSLLDMGDADIPLIIAKGNGLNAADIARNVAADEDDRHTQALFDDLRNKVKQGDIHAQRRLLLGLQKGLVMTESGEEFKVQKDSELQREIAGKLSAKQVSGGDYALVILKEPLLVNGQMDALPTDGDGQKLLDEVLADARRYYSPAMYLAFRMYGRGLPGVQEDQKQSSLWWKRYRSMTERSSKFVPYLDEAGKAEYRKFDSASNPRYFALTTSGAYGLSTGEDASVQAAIAACEARNGGSAEHCRLYARNGLMEWEACPAGYEGSMVNTFPPVTGMGDIDDIAHLPLSVGDNGKTAYCEFLKAMMPRAFAVADSGETAMASGDCHAAYKALQACSERTGKNCKLYALDDQIVLGATDPKLAEQEQRLTVLVERASQGKAKLASHTVPVAESAKN